MFLEFFDSKNTFKVLEDAKYAALPAEKDVLKSVFYLIKQNKSGTQQ